MPNRQQDPRDNGEIHRCTRCEQILRSPEPTSCGHRFCEPCLRVLATRRMPGRPLCQICSDDCVAEDFTKCDLAQSMNMQRSCSATYMLNREALKKGFRVANESMRNRVRLEEISDEIEKMEQRATEPGALLEKYGITHTYKRKLQTELTSLEEKIQILEDSLRLTESILESQDQKMVKQEERLRALEENPPSFDGKMIWKITGVQQHCDDARDNNASLTSPCFYTGHEGYKMRARLYLNGDGIGSGSHLSLYLIVQKNDLDFLLPWPFQQQVNFTLRDLNHSGNDIVAMFIPDPPIGHQQSPTNDVIPLPGCPQFMKLEDFVAEYERYVKEDAMYLEVEVDKSNILR
ncbi:uncharacterized protein LOC102807823 [Saccoglossus kowalevskii]|uniref:TNF receptor-associated factor 3-like n=1 Tax=Saccoglossus kowalevskii TaxID=10224 RepID=A0ABM0MXA5_SACKO|nr:PREDICTED: TNF receptor-associated factor 3-like [Saccoglossus kowalevskii]